MDADAPGRLSIIEGRVLGSLLEKQRTVPDQYPLTANALLGACNQTSARDPLLHLAEHDVLTAVTSLKAAGLLRFVHPAHGRSVTRYRQIADEHWGLDLAESALLAVLLLRGPQTAAELVGRSARLHELGSIGEAEAGLRAMAERGLVELMDRQPGQKEQRWCQLVAEQAETTPAAPRLASGAPAAADPGLGDRVAELEARVARLEAALAELL